MTEQTDEAETGEMPFIKDEPCVNSNELDPSPGYFDYITSCIEYEGASSTNKPDCIKEGKECGDNISATDANNASNETDERHIPQPVAGLSMAKLATNLSENSSDDLPEQMTVIPQKLEDRFACPNTTSPCKNEMPNGINTNENLPTGSFDRNNLAEQETVSGEPSENNNSHCEQRIVMIIEESLLHDEEDNKFNTDGFSQDDKCPEKDQSSKYIKSITSSRSKRKRGRPRKVVKHQDTKSNDIKAKESKDPDWTETPNTTGPPADKERKQRRKKKLKVAKTNTKGRPAAKRERAKVKIVGGKKLYQCDQCDLEVEGFRALKQHQKVHPFKCEICNIVFTLKHSLTVHMRSHTGENQHICESCGKAFNTETLLRYHKRKHTGEKPYECEFCGKMFATSSYLTRHRRVHTGESPYTCPVCGRAFKYSSSYRDHKQQHLGEKKFKCDVCDRPFLRESDMRIHKMVHTGEKPFVCEECGKAFRTVSKLGRHMFVHTGVTKSMATCEYCGKNFSQKCALTEHRRIHTGERPFVCPVCHKAFGSYKSINRHKKIHVREGRGHLLTKAATDTTEEKELGEITPEEIQPSDGESLFLYSSPDGLLMQSPHQEASMADKEVAAPTESQEAGDNSGLKSAPPSACFNQELGFSSSGDYHNDNRGHVG